MVPSYNLGNGLIVDTCLLWPPFQTSACWQAPMTLVGWQTQSRKALLLKVLETLARTDFPSFLHPTATLPNCVTLYEPYPLSIHFV